MEITRLNGTDARLYQLVAPIIMSPSVLRQNNNYPFKTTGHYLWYVAESVVSGVEGFLPLKPVGKGYCIDNYYIKGDNPIVLEKLLGRAIEDYSCGTELKALVHKRHVEIFCRMGFFTTGELRRYDKMEYRRG
ncbi:MAG: hypothetical protein IJ383_08840 [Bacteroidales bacterium]|nr:hypothetical protein [Bacteroidales bacterium]